MDHPEIKRRLETARKIGFWRSFGLSMLYLAAVFVNGFLVLAVINTLWQLDTTTAASTVLTAGVYFVVIVLDFGLLYYNKVTPAILTLVVIFAWIILPYQFISGKNFLDKKRTPNEIRKSIFHRSFPFPA
jgi:Kef-type K+ transport system membrane component KefB